MSALTAQRTPRLHRPDDVPPQPARRRAEWRQRLIDAEGGWRLALRSGSTLYAHFFGASLIAVTGVVFGFSLVEWLALIAIVALSLTAELLLLAAQSLASELAPGAAGTFRRPLRLAAAAALTTHFAATAVVFGIIARHIGRLFG